MGLRKMKSKFFGNSSPSSTFNISISASHRSSGPPPMPAMPTIPAMYPQRSAPPAPQPVQKPQKIQKQAPPTTYVTNANIRELRELIRYRYALDCKIWSIGRKVKWYQRDTVEADMRRSDAALKAIHNLLDGWDRPEYFETMEQYKKFKEIKTRIMEAKTRSWEANPPWAKEETETHDSVHEKDGRPIYVQHVHDSRRFSRY